MPVVQDHLPRQAYPRRHSSLASRSRSERVFPSAFIEEVCTVYLTRYYPIRIIFSRGNTNDKEALTRSKPLQILLYLVFTLSGAADSYMVYLEPLSRLF